MDYSGKSLLIVISGLLWGLVMSIATFAVAFGMYQGLISLHRENGSVYFVIDEDHKNIIQTSAWMELGIATFTSIAAASIRWGSTRVRAQAVTYYEESNGFPFNYAPQAVGRLVSIGAVGVVEGLLLLVLLLFVMGSVTIDYFLQNLEEDKTGDVDYWRIFRTSAHVINILSALILGVVTYLAIKYWRIVKCARTPQPAARAADAGQALQDAMEMEDMQASESDEPTRLIASNLRQRSEHRRSAGEEVRPLQ